MPAHALPLAMNASARLIAPPRVPDTRATPSASSHPRARGRSSSGRGAERRAPRSSSSRGGARRSRTCAPWTWPSPSRARLGSPIVSVTRRQDSLHVAARALAPSEEALDAPLRRRISRSAPGACYRAFRYLPVRDFHPLARCSFQEAPRRQCRQARAIPRASGMTTGGGELALRNTVVLRPKQGTWPTCARRRRTAHPGPLHLGTRPVSDGTLPDFHPMRSTFASRVHNRCVSWLTIWLVWRAPRGNLGDTFGPDGQLCKGTCRQSRPMRIVVLRSAHAARSAVAR